MSRSSEDTDLATQNFSCILCCEIGTETERLNLYIALADSCRVREFYIRLLLIYFQLSLCVDLRAEAGNSGGDSISGYTTLFRTIKRRFFFYGVRDRITAGEVVHGP